MKSCDSDAEENRGEGRGVFRFFAPMASTLALFASAFAEGIGICALVTDAGCACFTRDQLSAASEALFPIAS